MQLQRVISAVLFLSMTAVAQAQGTATPSVSPVPPPEMKGDTFRTPAKRYGAAYTIKLTLKRGLTEYVTTMWVKPDQAESTLDYGQMKELGWSEPLDSKKPYLNFDDASLVGVPIEKTSFKNAKSEWAYVPDFPRSCCYGIIGRDILSQYRQTFMPKNPAHIEWTKIDVDPKLKWSNDFLAMLKSLFSFQTEVGTFKKRKIDLSEMGYELNLSKSTLNFEPAPQSKEEKGLTPRAQALFTFYFVPPVRKAKIESISPSVAKSAAKIGIKPGMLISYLDGKSLFLLDQFDVQAYLKGKRNAILPMTIDQIKHPVAFDFKKGEFVGQ